MTSQSASWRLKSPVTQRIIQPLVYASFKEDIKFRSTATLQVESTGDRWIPLTKGQ